MNRVRICFSQQEPYKAKRESSLKKFITRFILVSGKQGTMNHKMEGSINHEKDINHEESVREYIHQGYILLCGGVVMILENFFPLLINLVISYQ